MLLIGTRSSINDVSDATINIKLFLHRWWRVTTTNQSIFEKGNGKILFQQTLWYENAIFDSMENVLTDTIRGVSLQLFELNEWLSKLVWRKCERELNNVYCVLLLKNFCVIFVFLFIVIIIAYRFVHDFAFFDFFLFSRLCCIVYAANCFMILYFVHCKLTLLCSELL